MLTHGHDDHIGSTVEICKATGATLIANFEVCVYLAGKGVENYSPGNHGGQIDFGAFSVAFVPAWHSSSTIVDGVPIYLGNPAGVVITAKGERTLLHMGDTDIFPGHGADQRILRAEDRHRADRRPLHHGGEARGARLQALSSISRRSSRPTTPRFGLLDPDAEKFIAAMKNEKAKVLVPERGVAVAL